MNGLTNDARLNALDQLAVTVPQVSLSPDTTLVMGALTVAPGERVSVRSASVAVSKMAVEDLFPAYRAYCQSMPLNAVTDAQFSGRTLNYKIDVSVVPLHQLGLSVTSFFWNTTTTRDYENYALTYHLISVLFTQNLAATPDLLIRFVTFAATTYVVLRKTETPKRTYLTAANQPVIYALGSVTFTADGGQQARELTYHSFAGVPTSSVNGWDLVIYSLNDINDGARLNDGLPACYIGLIEDAAITGAPGRPVYVLGVDNVAGTSDSPPELPLAAGDYRVIMVNNTNGLDIEASASLELRRA
jgi:hypothetical protein